MAAFGSSTTSLEVRVDGKVDRFERAMLQAQRATMRTERELAKLDQAALKIQRDMNDETARRLEAQHAAYSKVGRGMMVAGAGMVAGAALSAKAAMEWE